MVALREVLVDTNSEKIFLKAIEGNFAEYFFFHVDYAQYPEKTVIYMALDDSNQVHAMVLFWTHHRIQLRGSLTGLEFLLERHHPQLLSVTGFEEHISLIEKFYPNYTVGKTLYGMSMKPHEFIPQKTCEIKCLNESYKDQIALLMRTADPVFWGGQKSEDLIIDANNNFYAISDKDELLSIAGLWEYENVCYLPIVATHKDHWGKGYASSLISSVISPILSEKEEILIQVRMENAPAVHVYSRLGFKIRNSRFMFEKPTV